MTVGNYTEEGPGYGQVQGLDHKGQEGTQRTLISEGDGEAYFVLMRYRSA
jgi:hypothetical protein